VIYVNNNEKLADLLERLTTLIAPSQLDFNDAKDLIHELRSPRGEISLVNTDEFRKQCTKHW